MSFCIIADVVSYLHAEVIETLLAKQEFPHRQTWVLHLFAECHGTREDQMKTVDTQLRKQIKNKKPLEQFKKKKRILLQIGFSKRVLQNVFNAFSISQKIAFS